MKTKLTTLLLAAGAMLGVWADTNDLSTVNGATTLHDGDVANTRTISGEGEAPGNGDIEPIGSVVEFYKTEVVASEHSTMDVVVTGNGAAGPASVQVYLTYNSATAADFDLANGSVDGVTPKGGLKFPLTISWNTGDCMPKTISIPVKIDKTLEDEETLTFQLANPVGVELGLKKTCGVWINDPDYFTLAKKVKDGTATKAESNTWAKVNRRGVPYMTALAYPADGGKVTGSDYCPEGKKVTMKATSNKGWVFLGWRQGEGRSKRDEGRDEEGFVATTPSLVIDRTAKPGKDTKTSTTLTNITESATFFAEFVTSGVDKGSITAGLNGCGFPVPADGEPVSLATNVMAGVYLEWPVSAGALSQTTVKVAGLPAGLKFTAKDIMKKGSKTEVEIPANTIYGTPTAASKTDKNGVKPSDVKITVTTAGKSSITYLVKLTVDPLPAWAVGTFDGTVQTGTTDVSSVANGQDARYPSGTVSLTIAASGKINGKMLEGGKTWTLSAASFDVMKTGTTGVPSVGTVVFHATVIGKAGKEIVTNEVTVAAEGGIGVVNGRDDRSPSATDGMSVVSVEWTAGQNLWKRADTKASQPVFKKSVGVTLGADIKLTFKKDGAVSFAGKVDGVSVSGSSQLVRLAEDGSPYQVTFYAPSKPTAKPPFAGWCETLDVKLIVDDANAVTKVDLGGAEYGKVQLWKGGPYWATKNIGAEKPEDSGYYFWWGDTIGYKWKNGSWAASDGSESRFSFCESNTPTFAKHVTTLQSEGWITADGVLAPEHDAAQVQWGHGWRMPTDGELQALCDCDNCDWTWTRRNGVYGYEVCGKGDYSSKSIFLPVAGGGNGIEPAEYVFGLLWSSVPYNISSWEASCLQYSSCCGYFMARHVCYFGFPIRPVQGFTE